MCQRVFAISSLIAVCVTEAVQAVSRVELQRLLSLSLPSNTSIKSCLCSRLSSRSPTRALVCGPPFHQLLDMRTTGGDDLDLHIAIVHPFLVGESCLPISPTHTHVQIPSHNNMRIGNSRKQEDGAGDERNRINKNLCLLSSPRQHVLKESRRRGACLPGPRLSSLGQAKGGFRFKLQILRMRSPALLVCPFADARETVLGKKCLCIFHMESLSSPPPIFRTSECIRTSENNCSLVS